LRSWNQQKMANATQVADEMDTNYSHLCFFSNSMSNYCKSNTHFLYMNMRVELQKNYSVSNVREF